MDLSDRQRQLLKAIIELYIKTGEPIGSETVEKKFNLGVSPATIRNEMVKLIDSGYLKQLHTSAGRIPTAMGFRLYVNELMQEWELPVVDEVAIRQQMLEKRTQYAQLLKEATRTLAKKCGILALAIDDNDIYYSGVANILDIPEFYDIDVTRFVLSLFDEYPILLKIMNRAIRDDRLHIIFGEETEYSNLSPTGFAFVDYEISPEKIGTVGVIGPARLNFPVVIPYLRFVAQILSEATGRY